VRDELLPFRPSLVKAQSGAPPTDGLTVEPVLVRFAQRRLEVEHLKALHVIAHQLPRLVAAVEALASVPPPRRFTRS
jgi:hypothetical protein